MSAIPIISNLFTVVFNTAVASLQFDEVLYEADDPILEIQENSGRFTYASIAWTSTTAHCSSPSRNLLEKCKAVGGYLTTFEAVAACARRLGLEWDPNSRAIIGGRKAFNRWMIDQDPVLWYFRLEPVGVTEPGATTETVKLIFPTVGSIMTKPDDFTFPEDGPTTTNFMTRAQRASVPEELLQNFVTIVNPDISIVPEPYGSPESYIPLGSELWLIRHSLPTEPHV
ncbi:hypothetical protein RhiJN_16627 [Ceratobasidium sp. AG-Ba]|nr:hypothetical protein RhiJN_16627 [Ceratobasidium sp. AG-Ba]